MKKASAVLFSILQKMSEPKNIRIMMFVLPIFLGIEAGGSSLLDVGGNPGGCTGG